MKKKIIILIILILIITSGVVAYLYFKQNEEGINELEKKIDKEIKDREEAIEYAMKNALEGDMILLIGKGHEQYQETKGVQYFWDEREAVERVKARLNQSK